ncbi:MAG: ABC transporter substrate-binding protein [Cyanobacteria bacterium CRU_2_1]|nr:ABC transporter substrate-binding protein [Cyanobacteria bacterium RU_5_0]NJR58439.1 ABC transporter substrate-binding protein [Cyanobacteria bacterium CRU_2_1]
MKKSKSNLTRRALLSGVIALLAIAFAYVPIPGLTQTVTVVSGTELQEVLPALKTKFEQDNPSIKLDLRFQGSQDVVNNYIDEKNDFTPAVLIPANAEALTELDERWRSQNSSDPFYDAPRPIAKTVLVGVAWSDRGNVLFPNGQFDWNRLEQVLQKGNWQAIGGSGDWGSFDLGITDPTRSNSGQLTMGLWAQSKARETLNVSTLNDPAIQPLFDLVKRSVYSPPRSTDILLQEFITRGPNDADVATVYESIALHRWQESSTTQGKPYQIYYINPTVETVSTAAIVRRDVGSGTAKAARQFLDFLTQPAQQELFVQYGFRPIINSIDLRSVPSSPWSQDIPGVEVNLPNVIPPPDRTTLSEIVRLWQRAS